jgi:hypothetical protein
VLARKQCISCANSCNFTTHYCKYSLSTKALNNKLETKIA